MMWKKFFVLFLFLIIILPGCQSNSNSQIGISSDDVINFFTPYGFIFSEKKDSLMQVQGKVFKGITKDGMAQIEIIGPPNNINEFMVLLCWPSNLLSLYDYEGNIKRENESALMAVQNFFDLRGDSLIGLWFAQQQLNVASNDFSMSLSYDYTKPNPYYESKVFGSRKVEFYYDGDVLMILRVQNSQNPLYPRPLSEIFGSKTP